MNEAAELPTVAPVSVDLTRQVRLGHLPLAQLLDAGDDTVLGHMLRRLAEDPAAVSDGVSAFESAI